VVKVAGDGVFQAGGGYGEFQGFCRAVPCRQGVDQAATEGVAATDAVNDVDLVAPGTVKLPAVVQQGRPTVVKSGEAFAQGNGRFLQVKEFLLDDIL